VDEWVNTADEVAAAAIVGEEMILNFFKIICFCCLVFIRSITHITAPFDINISAIILVVPSSTNKNPL